jgi:hypothetical protein
MKTLFATTAAIATVFALAGPVSAQMYQQPLAAPPPPTYQAPQPMQMPQPTVISSTPSWMRDDGSSSDHPIHNPGDQSGSRLNSQYQGGLTTAPGTGLPAQPGQ